MYKPEPIHIKDDFFAVEETNWKPVTKDGYVLNKWGKKTKGFLGDYYRTNIKPNKVMAVHRIVALTFLPHNSDVSKLDVNHIDGNKQNNHISNLEWVNRSENNLHAVKVGLAAADRKIQVKDLYTNQVYRFKTIRAAARHIGCYQNSLHAYLHYRHKKPFRGKWSVRIGDEPWVVFGDVKPTAFGYNVRDDGVVIAVNLKGGKHILFPTLDAASKYTNDDVKLDIRIGDYFYCLLNDLSSYSYTISDILSNCEYDTTSLEMNDNNTIKKPKAVEVIYKGTGKKEIYTSLRKFSDAIFPDIPYNTLRAMILRNKGEFDNLIVRYISHP